MSMERYCKQLSSLYCQRSQTPLGPEAVTLAMTKAQDILTFQADQRFLSLMECRAKNLHKSCGARGIHECCYSWLAVDTTL